MPAPQIPLGDTECLAGPCGCRGDIRNLPEVLLDGMQYPWVGILSGICPYF